MKLTYEDVKDLMDAGFPLKKASADGSTFLTNHEYYSFPTLSELIEAFDYYAELSLRKRDLKPEWLATASHSGELNDWVHGKTPEQAVKNLYISLKTKGKM